MDEDVRKDLIREYGDNFIENESTVVNELLWCRLDSFEYKYYIDESEVIDAI